MTEDAKTPKPREAAARDAQEQEEAATPSEARPSGPRAPKARPKEIGGPKGPEPTRYGDWEVKGIASDF